MKHQFVKKGQILQTKGELNSKIFIVQAGLLRCYAIDDKGKEHIYMFAPEGWTAADSTPPNLPSELFIDALEDSELMILEKDKEDKPHFQRILKRLYVLQTRIIMLMSATAIQRYEHFIDTSLPYTFKKCW